MTSLFLTETEKKNIKEWRYQVEDHSISTLILRPWWNYSLSWIPKTVAPNVLTLAGFICVLMTTYLTSVKLETNPNLTIFLVMLLIFSYQTLDALDGMQARKIRNSSPLGELFDHTCDNISIVFLVFTLCWIFGFHSTVVQWLIMNIVQTGFMMAHMIALKHRVITFGRFSGPGEVMLVVYLLLGLKLTGYDHPDLSIVFNQQVLTALAVVINLVTLSYATGMNYSTRNGVILSIFFRFISSWIAYSGSNGIVPPTQMDVFSDGLFWCIVTGDLITAKMASREIHPMIVIFSMASVLFPGLGSYRHYPMVAMALFYYWSIFYEIAKYLRLPIFQVVQNVYVNGVFDMTHYGHANLFKSALTFGNRLIVGVMSDEDTDRHKSKEGDKRPKLNLRERVNSVLAYSEVSEVIENAPWDSVPKELIDQHNIHIVAHSAEYDTPEDTYYKIPRDLGITRVLPRTEGISTSEKIKLARD